MKKVCILLVLLMYVYHDATKNVQLTVCTTRFKIQKFCVLSTVHVCVSRGSQNKQKLFLYTEFTYQFL
jgi:hypothetical protein